MLLEQTRDYISDLSDGELIEYVLEGIYEPDAIAFARQEIERRQLDPQQMQQLEAVAQERVDAKRAHIAEVMNEPLGCTGRTLAFMGGFFMGFTLHFIIWIVLDRKCETRKQKDIREFALAGFYTLLISILVIPLVVILRRLIH